MPDPEPVNTDNNGILDHQTIVPIPLILGNLILILTESVINVIQLSDDLLRNPPKIISLSNGITINWTQKGDLAQSFDIIIDGHDTNLKDRNSSFSQTVKEVSCFIIQDI